MKQIDVLLRQRPFECVVTIAGAQSYDLILPSKTRVIDLTIDGLLDRQGIYGDELDPLIFHLSENEIECLLSLNLLANTFLYTLDNSLLRGLDDNTLETLENASSNNLLTLKQNAVSVFNTLSLGADSATLQLLSQVTATLEKTLSTRANDMRLAASVDLTSEKPLPVNGLNASLLTNIYSDLVNTVYLCFRERGVHWLNGLLSEYDPMTLDEIGRYTPKMSLVSREGNVYLRFTLPLTDSTMSLSGAEQDVTLHAVMRSGRNSVALTADPIGVCNNTIVIQPHTLLTVQLVAPEQEVTSVPHVQPVDAEMELSCIMDQASGLTVMLSGVDAASLQCDITDDIELDHGMEFFDDELLMYWDDWLLEGMEAAARIA